MSRPLIHSGWPKKMIQSQRKDKTILALQPWMVNTTDKPGFCRSVWRKPMACEQFSLNFQDRPAYDIIFQVTFFLFFFCSFNVNIVTIATDNLRCCCLVSLISPPLHSKRKQHCDSSNTPQANWKQNQSLFEKQCWNWLPTLAPPYCEQLWEKPIVSHFRPACSPLPSPPQKADSWSGGEGVDPKRNGPDSAAPQHLPAWQPGAAHSTRRTGDLHGNLQGGGDKPLRFKVPPIKTKFISSPEHWKTST